MNLGPNSESNESHTTGPPRNSQKFEIKSPSSKIFQNAMSKINFICKTLISSLINNEFNNKRSTRITRKPKMGGSTGEEEYPIKK